MGGGVGGGVGLLALIGLIFFCICRHGLRCEQKLNERPRPFFSVQPTATFTNTEPASINPFGSAAALSIVQPSGTSHLLQSRTDPEASSTPNLMALGGSSPRMNISHACISSSDNISAMSSARININRCYSNNSHASGPGCINADSTRTACSTFQLYSVTDELFQRKIAACLGHLAVGPIREPGRHERARERASSVDE